MINGNRNGERLPYLPWILVVLGLTWSLAPAGRSCFAQEFIAPNAPAPLGAGAAEPDPATAEAAAGEAAVAATWAAQIRGDVGYLTSEALRGRSAADESIQLAADYLAQRFQEIGLNTQVFGESPFQDVPIPLDVRPGDEASNQAIFTQDGETIAQARLNDGMGPLAIGSSTAVSELPVVFAGYGITDKEVGYNDYAAVDVTGKAVILIRKEPGLDDPNSPFDGRRTSRNAYFDTKVNLAMRRGAAAILFVNDTGSLQQSVERVERRLQVERARFSQLDNESRELPNEATKTRNYIESQKQLVQNMIDGYERDLLTARRGVIGVTEAGMGGLRRTRVPILSLSRDVVDQLLDRAIGQSLSSLENQIRSNYQPATVELPNVRAAISTSTSPASTRSPNVLAVLEGRGRLSDQTVVLGAHYDHVGMGGEGSLAPGTIAIHNGADDNASGTSVLLAAAKQLVGDLRQAKEHRRVVFIAFTGEERGLLGSKHYVSQPRFPLAQTVAMVNLDMVGRLRDNELTVYGTGSGTKLNGLVDRVNEGLDFRLFKVPSGYGPSDHQSFYQAGIPVLFFFTGLHGDYHRPSDDADKLNVPGMVRITSMVSGVVRELATDIDRPFYQSTSKRFRIRKQLTTFLGIQFDPQPDGLRVTNVVADSPADTARLQIGDLIKQIDNQKVRQSGELLEFLRDKLPGNEVAVEIDRDGVVLSRQITLGRRP
ncbi:MAG: M28 family peptidase [Planctomycetota bacterium]